MSATTSVFAELHRPRCTREGEVSGRSGGGREISPGRVASFSGAAGGGGVGVGVAGSGLAERQRARSASEGHPSAR